MRGDFSRTFGVKADDIVFLYLKFIQFIVYIPLHTVPTKLVPTVQSTKLLDMQLISADHAHLDLFLIDPLLLFCHHLPHDFLVEPLFFFLKMASVDKFEVAPGNLGGLRTFKTEVVCLGSRNDVLLVGVADKKLET
jgi:hypothetical protein